MHNFALADKRFVFSGFSGAGPVNCKNATRGCNISNCNLIALGHSRRTIPSKWSKTMRKLSSLILAATALSVTVPAASAQEAERNDRLYDATGSSVAKVNRVTETGDVLVIYKGKVRRIDASTLSESEGKLMTSLTKTEIRRLD